VTYSIVREGQPAVRDQLSSPEQVANWARAVIPDDGREHFYLAMLDSQNRLLLTHHVSTGSLSASIVHPREALGPAVREGAAHVVFAHNHPSGDPTPSSEDIGVTYSLVTAARVLGVKVHDHVIIGQGSRAYVSLRDRRLM
jgi:DNA repair protein RadC